MTHQRIAVKATVQQLIAMANRASGIGSIANIYKIGNLKYQVMTVEGDSIEIKWNKNVICSIDNFSRNERFYAGY